MAEGKAFIVAGVEEELDPMLDPVLNKEIQSRNDGDTINQSKPYSGGIGGPCEVFDPPCAALPLLCSG